MEQNNAMGKKYTPSRSEGSLGRLSRDCVCQPTTSKTSLAFFKAACNINLARDTLQIAEQNVLSGSIEQEA